ncbi:hypothetical protein SAMN06265371_105209 [Lutibacter agarilyticus]|uniref:Uncharacterized protein n=1 Tax=Lutibacter agarilyticus TaxID=1109740 RepID=A0A238XDJ7_9FLAO|nr:hypothetical protein [Lutibacter agarilyticus]SNR56583.1 hypothetical protein SAMN06265371_105209 [Lutibacter agarilyticus]
MHKKLEAELVSLAHSILQLKNNDDVTILHKKARDIYEKLSVLKFVNANLNEMYVEAAEEEIVPEVKELLVEKRIEVTEKVEVVPEIIMTEEAVEEVAKEVIEETVEDVVEVFEEKKIVEEILEEPKEILSKEEVDAIFAVEDDLVKDDIKDLEATQFTLEDEFKDAISSDVATELFEKATKENPVITTSKETKPRSLNDTLFSANLQVGLNDRIAFVKHLFEGSQEDFNRVLSQLNSFKTEDEAKTFLQEFVKPDYDWGTKEEYEERFMTIIERKFL